MTTMWIGPDESLRAGDVGFLVERSHNLHGTSRYGLCDTPAHSNLSHEPRLHGWCGTTDDVATYGRGMARVERLAKNGRALVRVLTGDELAEALEEHGYPDLAE